MTAEEVHRRLGEHARRMSATVQRGEELMREIARELAAAAAVAQRHRALPQIARALAVPEDVQ